MARKTLSDRGVAALKARAKRYFYPDPQLTGHYVRVSPDGTKVFYTQARGPDGKQKWVAIGAADTLAIEEAREQARAVLRRIRAGQSAREEVPDTFRAVAESFLQRHVRAQGLISAGEVERVIRKHVFPVWGDRPFTDIRRVDIAKLLDGIEDRSGPRMADLTLAHLRKMASWFENRDDNYISPYRRGMRRASGTARARVLDDRELVAVWRAAEANGAFGAFVRLALLTAQRKDKIATMKWEDICDGVWKIRTKAREKGTAGELALPPAAVDIIRARPRMGDNPFVFAGRGNWPFNIWTKGKRRLDKASGVSGWTIHDLRRTARSLLSRAGVQPHICERTLGHKLQGVEAVYDRHSYRVEMGAALRKLAGLIDAIVNPRENVVVMTKRSKRR